jgi:MOSC domain-containing protein YiiM
MSVPWPQVGDVAPPPAVSTGGRLVGIYTTVVRGTPMTARSEAVVMPGTGLDGDRYAAGTGTYSSRPGPGRAVTLISREAVAAVVAETGLRLAESETRRNLVTTDVALDDLIGRTFRVGEVVLRGARTCPPCAYLEEILARPGVWQALKHRGGLRADVVTGGTVHLGDTVSVLATRPDTPGGI